MKRVLTMSLATLLIGFACAAAAFAQGTSQSLGDYARSLKKSKSAPAPAPQKVYDNDTMPTSASISVVGNSSSSTDAATTNEAKNADAPAATGDKKDEPQIKAGQSIDERKQAVDAWKQKLDDQNEKIGAISHELELLQREYRVKAAEFYADTARRTQNPTGFAKDDADYKQQIADKQKALDAAKAKVSDLQEEARKAGAPTSVADQN
jgi:hypothetical protein